MTITFTINTSNAAFDGNSGGEVIRILQEFISKNSLYSRDLRDANGNTVGRVTVTGK